MSSLLEDRYGVRDRPRWMWPVVAVVGIGLAVAWSAWVAFQPTDVSAVLHSYDVTSDSTVVLTLEVHRPEPLEVECSVYAQGRDHSIVGERTVRMPAVDEETVREEVVVETTARAVTGVIRSCQAVQ